MSSGERGAHKASVRRRVERNRPARSTSWLQGLIVLNFHLSGWERVYRENPPLAERRSLTTLRNFCRPLKK